MPLPYSVDLRERVLSAHERGEGPAESLATRFQVAANTVRNWVHAAEAEGRRVARPLGHGPAPRLGEAERAVLHRLVTADNDATLAEYRTRLGQETGVTVCLSVLCQTLQRMGLRRKKRLSGRASKSVRRLSPSARPIALGSPLSPPKTSSFSTRPGSAPS